MKKIIESKEPTENEVFFQVRKNRWKALCKFNGKVINFGVYSTKEEALDGFRAGRLALSEERKKTTTQKMTVPSFKARLFNKESFINPEVVDIKNSTIKEFVLSIQNEYIFEDTIKCRQMVSLMCDIARLNELDNRASSLLNSVIRMGYEPNSTVDMQMFKKVKTTEMTEVIRDCLEADNLLRLTQYTLERCPEKEPEILDILVKFNESLIN